MSNSGSGSAYKHTPAFISRFAAAYNDIESYPGLDDVAAELEISYQTVRNYAREIRRQCEDQGVECPLISRRLMAKPSVDKPVKPEKPSAIDQAHSRADRIRTDMSGLFQSSAYPVVNPEALVIEPKFAKRYDALVGDYVQVAGQPRAWLTDTLRVAPISDARGRRLIFTGAQNEAQVHEDFWLNLLAYAEAIDAEIVVGPWTYETNWWDENNPFARDYDPALREHLCFGQLEIGDNFVFCGEMNTLPTAPQPIADLTAYTRGRWGVFPHAKLQLLSVPSTDPNKQAHQVMTTGAVTRPKVIPRKAGIKSIFHHIYGATVVEFDEEGDVFCRQINATEDGSFYDLDAYVSDARVSYGHAVRAVTFADVHLAKLGSRNSLATFGFDQKTGLQAPDSILVELQPEHIFLEDLHDNEKGSHHRKDDVHFHYEMAVRDRDTVEDEVIKAADFLLKILDQPAIPKIHVVESNHDVHLERYVREGRYREDGGHNLEFGLKLDLAYTEYRKAVAKCLDNETSTPKFSLLEWAVRYIAGADLDPVHWIYDGNDSFVLDGIEVGHHGHRGSNGGFGTPSGFAKLGRRMTIGDKHSPQILDGVYVAGSMELQHGYNKGPSGWAVTHVVQYPNGKRTLVTLQKGKWRAPRNVV